MNLEEFFGKDPWKLHIFCKRCGAIVHDMQQHYDWHHSVDSIATVKVVNNAHTRP